jgi:phage tail-like protein
MSEAGTRMLESLPAIYRASDSGGHLGQLLGAFEEILFYNEEGQEPFGIEQQIDAIPSLFSPLGDENTRQLSYMQTPDRFLSWLATWVAFTPHELFSPDQLRTLISRIVPLYAKRGTRAYLEELLKLCFEEISDVKIDEDAASKFKVGHCRVGIDTLFGDERPFWFHINIALHRHKFDKKTEKPPHEFEQQVRRIIDFGKPGHTAYELSLEFSNMDGGRFVV